MTPFETALIKIGGRHWQDKRIYINLANEEFQGVAGLTWQDTGRRYTFFRLDGNTLSRNKGIEALNYLRNAKYYWDKPLQVFKYSGLSPEIASRVKSTLESMVLESNFSQ